MNKDQRSSYTAVSFLNIVVQKYLAKLMPVSVLLEFKATKCFPVEPGFDHFVSYVQVTTGIGIKDVRVSKKGWVFIGQKSRIFDVTPRNYTLELHVSRLCTA